ncbi:MAG: hypothetical protein OXN23_07910 [Gammaproteobacteria bacterium]|nr:hypothetical protein [Gammaproteobacteria bacterium]
MVGQLRAVNARLLLLAAALAAPAQALELGQPEIHFEPDCSALVTLRLVMEAGIDPEQLRIEVAAPPTYRKLQKTYPSWISSARLERSRENGEHWVQVRSEEPLPSHPNDLVLVLGEGYELLEFYTLNLPPCTPAGTTREVAWGDTLLEIALEQARSREVDAYTLMLAIQLYNRNAFIHDNINLVRAGTQLYIPSQAEIARLNLSRQWLIDEIQFQNEQWRKWRREGTDLRESPTLQERRLQLVPLEMQAESATPEPTTPETDPAEPSALEPIKAEPAESGITDTQPTAPEQIEPDEASPAESEPAASAEPETEKTEAPLAMAEIEAKALAPLADGSGDEGTAAKVASGLPWPGILTAAGILLLVYLSALTLNRARQARIIRESVGDIEDSARRATSALDLAHAHVEANEYDQARPLIRLVLAEGTEQEREEAERLKSRMGSS